MFPCYSLEGSYSGIELCFTSLNINHSKFFCTDLFLFTYLFIYLFNHLLISVWTHLYLFYTSGYNLVACYLVRCCNCFSFGQLWLVSIDSLDTPSSLYLFALALPFFLALQDAPGQYCILPSPALESATFPRSLEFVLLENDIKNHSLDSRRAHCYMVSLPVGHLRWQSKEICSRVLLDAEAHLKTWNGIFPWASRRKEALRKPWFSPCKIHFILLTSTCVKHRLMLG